MNRKTFGTIGAGVGLVAFLAVGMMPAMLYGGYAGVMLAGGIFGVPLQPTFAVRGLVFSGMVMGVLGVGGLFTLGGAAGGLWLSGLLRGSRSAAAHDEA